MGNKNEKARKEDGIIKEGQNRGTKLTEYYVGITPVES